MPPQTPTSDMILKNEPAPRMKTSFRYLSVIVVLLIVTTSFPPLMLHYFGSHLARPRIVLRQGTVVGFTSLPPTFPKQIDHFLGIPYGENTAGTNRFRPPVKVKDGDGVINATAYGPRCPAGPGPAVFGEDCLRMNVYRPSAVSSGHTGSVNRKNGINGVPVVVHVHGGAFNSGYGNVRDMATFIAQSVNPIVGISFNYRTGAFGFLSGEAAATEGGLNVGLRDMVLALEWVKDNIAAFGGDPNQVTVMGSSAGAHGIGHLLMYLEANDQDLFHKAIMESGAPTARAVYPYDHTFHKEQFQYFLNVLGSGDVADDRVMEKLRECRVEELKRASDLTFDHYNPSVKWPFQPVIDGPRGMIEQAPIKSWQQGKWKKMPILTGFNTNEGAMFVPDQISKSSQFNDFFQTLLPGFNQTDLNELTRVYPDPETDAGLKYRETRRGLGKQFKRTEQAYGQFAYVAPVKQTAHYASSAGEEAPVFLYHFAVNCSIKGGADHGTQSPFVVNEPGLQNVSEAIKDISGMMHAYWTSFIATGDPNAVKEGRYGTRPDWKRHVAGESSDIAVFGEGNNELAGRNEGGTIVEIKKDDFVVEESAFWQARTEKSES